MQVADSTYLVPGTLYVASSNKPFTRLESHLNSLRPSFSFFLPSRNSDLGSNRTLFPSPQPRYTPYIFIARIVQHFLPSSTRVELCLPTLGALGSWCLSRNKDSIQRMEPVTLTLVKPLDQRGDRCTPKTSEPAKRLLVRKHLAWCVTTGTTKLFCVVILHARNPEPTQTTCAVRQPPHSAYNIDYSSMRRNCY